ncbi:MAG TPA: ABC transporter permease subunit [Candidatus Saccharimonadales bacterium]|nr:ABC transporter permease subunit [Candidatus Saccharimonadales bacterium]
MIASLRSEFRKLLTTRATYVIALLFLGLSMFVDFYIHGYKDSITEQAILSGHSPLDQAQASLFVAGSLPQIANIASIACALIALLLVANEYRYNTIVYTLTMANRRSKVLAGKIIAVLALVLVYSVLFTTICLGLIWAGAASAGHSLPPQTIDLPVFYAKTVFFCESFAMAGMLFAALFRNQVGAIAALFVIPNMVEGLISLLLKHNSVYMPFMALQQVIEPPVVHLADKAGHPAHPATSALGSLSPGKGALVSLVYLVGGWIVAWVLFLKRDAN